MSIVVKNNDINSQFYKSRSLICPAQPFGRFLEHEKNVFKINNIDFFFRVGSAYILFPFERAKLHALNEWKTLLQASFSFIVYFDTADAE